MRYVLTYARALLHDERGQDLTEYGLLAGLIAIACIVTVGDLGGQINVLWTHIVDEIASIL